MPYAGDILAMIVRLSQKEGLFMIIETILSSINQEGKVNFAPVGVHIPNDSLTLLTVKEMEIFLYSGSHTYRNLLKTGEGVINFTDDMLSFVDTALFSKKLPAVPSLLVTPPRMAEAKLIWEFQVSQFDVSTEPSRVKTNILFMQKMGDYSGFCRARGAILEAAIAATRFSIMKPSNIEASFTQWQDIVRKTGGTREQTAFKKLRDYFKQQGISIPAFEE
jgi:hypothetical protein